MKIKLLIWAACALGAVNLGAEEAGFEVRGFHLDLRIQVMKLDALKELAKDLSMQGMNTLIMEWEGTFPYEKHPLIPNRYAYTKKEISEFIDYCAGLGLDVIPLQQSLGHLEYVLQHGRYAAMRESDADVSQLCPIESEHSRELFVDLFTELAELHTSEFIHIGGDEAYLFGQCPKCRKRVEEAGKPALLADHLKVICEIVVSMGKRPVLWADIANKYPEQLDKLPKETVFVIWNYGWDLDRFGDSTELPRQGFEIWGAPSLRSNPDNFYLTDWEKHIHNIRDFIPHCRESGYSGIIMTSWSTSGIYSPVLEDKQTIAKLVPVRHVYPISGFNLLIRSYTKAVHQDEPLDVEGFISDYCRERYGFSAVESKQFWKALKGLPYQVIDSEVENHPELSAGMLWERAREDLSNLVALRPEVNTREFEHYLLMSRIRENYLDFKRVESMANAIEFDASGVSEVCSDLDRILEKEVSIRREFGRLNGELLYPAQLEEENRVRVRRMDLLNRRLTRDRIGEREKELE